MSRAVLVLDLLFCLVFFLSCYMKAQNVEDTKLNVASYGIVTRPGLVFISTYLLLISELVLSILFAMEALPVFKEICTIGILLFFTLGTLYKRRQYGVMACSCFGSASFLNKVPVWRNVSLILLLFVKIGLERRTTTESHLLLTMGITLAITLVVEMSLLLSELRKTRRAELHVDLDRVMSSVHSVYHK